MLYDTRETGAEEHVRYSGLIVLAVTAVISSFAFAAELEIPPPAKSKDLSVHVNQPNCVRWTNECVNCTRGIDGAAPTCSNIGFACQPKAIRCLGLETSPNEPQKK